MNKCDKNMQGNKKALLKRIENAEKEIAECKAFLEEPKKSEELTFADLAIGDQFIDAGLHTNNYPSIKIQDDARCCWVPEIGKLKLFRSDTSKLVIRVRYTF